MKKMGTILLLLLNILKEVILGIAIGIGVTIVVLFEGMAKCSRTALLMRMFDGDNPFDFELESANWYEDAGYHFSNIGEIIEEIKQVLSEIEIKKTKKVKETVIDYKNKALFKIFHKNDILQYVKLLVKKSERLNNEDRKIILIKINEIFSNYTNEYMELLHGSINSTIQMDPSRSIQLLEKDTINYTENYG